MSHRQRWLDFWPDRRWRWLVVAFTLVMQAVSVGILIYCFALFVVPWLRDFEQDRATVMFAISVLQICTGIVSPFVGRLMDRYALMWLILTGLVLLVLGLGLMSIATAFWQILVIYAVLFSMTMALMGTLAAQTLVAKWFTEKRGLAIGISATGTSLGGMLLPIFVASLIVEFDWRTTVQLLAVGAIALVAPLAMLVLARTPNESTRTPAVAAPIATGAIISQSKFWIPLLALVPMNAAFGAVQFNIGAYATDLGHPESLIGRLIALNSFFMIVGKLFFGSVGDRIDHRYLLWLSMALMVATLWLLQGEPSFNGLLGAMVLVGLSGGGMLPLMGVIYSARFGIGAFGRIMGLVMMFITIGGLGPPLAGAIFDRWQSYDPAFQLFMLMLILAAIPIARLPGATSAFEDRSSAS